VSAASEKPIAVYGAIVQHPQIAHIFIDADSRKTANLASNRSH